MRANVIKGAALLLMVGCGSDNNGTPLPPLNGMQLTPMSVIVAVGKDTHVMSELTATNGQRFDVSSSATWSSADTTIATAGANGDIVGVAPGMTMVTASRDGQTGSAMVMVVAHDIVS